MRNKTQMSPELLEFIKLSELHNLSSAEEFNETKITNCMLKKTCSL